MAKSDKSSSKYDPVASSSGSPSEVSINAEPPAASAPAQASSIRTNIIKCSGVLVVLIVLALFVQGGQSDREIKESRLTPNPYRPPKAAPFQFRVHCPVSYYYQYLKRTVVTNIIQNITGGTLPNINEDLRRRLSEHDYNDSSYKYGPWRLSQSTVNNSNFDPSRLYVVAIESVPDSNNKTTLRYCSLMREWNGSCDDSDYLCVTPGAVFDFDVNSYADVIWINKLDPDHVPKFDTCISNSSNQSKLHCNIKAKKDGSTDTFHSPTDLGNPNKVAKSYINQTRWPVSTHVHGLEVRPNFDGNPLSWFDNNGTVGVGYMDLKNDCYFRQFERNKNVKNNNSKGYDLPNFYEFDQDPLEDSKMDLNKISKVNRYPNGQNPGNLWYHDHAMRLTNYNAKYGLSGMYIIRDRQAEKKLPTGKYQKFVMKTADNWDLGRQDYNFTKSLYYRYRILNNDPRSKTFVRFANSSGGANCSSGTSSSYLPFFIIGADSSLFDKPYNMGDDSPKEIELGSAQRIQILIKFEDNFKLCLKSTPIVEEIDTKPVPDEEIPCNVESRQIGRSDPDYPTNKTNNSTFDPSELDLSSSAPFVNLSLTEQNNITISKTRMRPIMLEVLPDTPTYNKPNRYHFKLNGHYEFGKGRSEDPEIGTTEDWWIINLSNEKHPIHVHLINFQVVDYVPLRNIVTNGEIVDLYLAEFYLQALQHHSVVGDENFTRLYHFFFDGSQKQERYTTFCNFYTGSKIQLRSQPRLDGKNFSDFIHQFETASYEVSQEDVFDSKGVSGIDLQETYTYGTDPAKDLFIHSSNCHNSSVAKGQTIHLFTCPNDVDMIPQWYRHWKDTAYIPVHAAYKYRIRWAQSGFNNTHPQGDFFHVPVDQLREFPGFVYHCHILFHEDNEMMRPIMMQPPAGTNFDSSGLCDQFSWDDKADCIESRCREKQNNVKLHGDRNIENRLLTE